MYTYIMLCVLLPCNAQLFFVEYVYPAVIKPGNGQFPSCRLTVVFSVTMFKYKKVNQ